MWVCNTIICTQAQSQSNQTGSTPQVKELTSLNTEPHLRWILYSQKFLINFQILGIENPKAKLNFL